MTLTRFADLIHLNTDRIADPLAAGIERFVGLEHIEPENLHIRSWGNVADGVTFTNKFKPGQVLFGKRRAYQRKVAVADFEGVCSSDIYVFESKDPNKLLPELLPFICQSEGFFEYAVKTSAGSLSPRTNWKHLANYEFPLPPVDEQRRIANLLWAADEVCSKYEDLLKSLHQTFKAISFDQFDYLLKNNVSLVPISEISSRFPQTGLYKKKDFYGSGVPTVHMGEMFAYDCIDKNTDLQKVQLNDKEIETYRLTDNDLLFGRRSLVLEGAGRCAYIGELDNTVCFESSMLRVTFNKEKINNRYVFEWFRSPQGGQRISSIITFTTVAGVKGADVDRLVVPLPDLELQRKIVDRIESVRRSIKSTEQTFQAAKKMRKEMIDNVLQRIE